MKYKVIYYGLETKTMFAINEKELDDLINWCVDDMINHCWGASWNVYEKKGNSYREVK